MLVSTEDLHQTNVVNKTAACKNKPNGTFNKISGHTSQFVFVIQGVS